jgi:hypothetical protein
MRLVRAFLASSAVRVLWDEVKLVDSVEANPYFRAQSIDLRLIVRERGVLALATLEVKGDTHPMRNLFLETVSDVRRCTPGTFTSSSAQWFFYFFLERSILWCIPLAEARAWFERERDSFPTREVESIRDGRRWRTRGALVPATRFETEVPGIRLFRCASNGRWGQIDRYQTESYTWAPTSSPSTCAPSPDAVPPAQAS